MSRTTVKLSARDYNNTASTASNFIGSGSISLTNLNLKKFVVGGTTISTCIPALQFINNVNLEHNFRYEIS